MPFTRRTNSHLSPLDIVTLTDIMNRAISDCENECNDFCDTCSHHDWLDVRDAKAAILRYRKTIQECEALLQQGKTLPDNLTLPVGWTGVYSNDTLIDGTFHTFGPDILGVPQSAEHFAGTLLDLLKQQ